MDSALDDRTLTMTRLLKATPAQVWAAWTDPEILPRWFGPAGYHCVTKEIDLRQGGVWRFDMIGPDGTVWPNRHRITRHTPMTGLAYLLDADSDAGEPMQVTIQLTPEPGGVRLVQTMILPTAEAKAGALAFGADKLGETTLDKLEAILASG